MTFKPQLAQTVLDLKRVHLPVLASIKLDGVRCEYRKSPRTDKLVAMSRKLLPIPNMYIRRGIEQYNLPHGLSGELIAGNSYSETESAVMSIDGTPDWTYNLFDYPGLQGLPSRLARSKALLELQLPARIKVIPQQMIESYDDLEIFKDAVLKAGYEGICLANPRAVYSYGRANLTVQQLLRYTPRIRKEAIAIGFVELRRNNNESELDYLGYTKRSKCQANMRPGGTLGAIRCRDLESGIVFEVGSFKQTKAKLQEYWNNQSAYINQIFTYDYKPFGVLEKPRQPVFLHWRNMK